LAVSGVTTYGISGIAQVDQAFWNANGSNFVRPTGVVCDLAAGVNTITISATRVNLDAGGGAPSGGSLTLENDFQAAIIGSC
jgi:hypothetical protein